VSFTSRLLAFASQRFPRLSSRVLASSGYTLDLTRYGDFGVWSPSTAERQDRAWQPIIAAAKAGNPREDVAALQAVLDEIPGASTLLEVGCGGGYNSEVVAFSAPAINYTGIDLSASMIEIAREHYPTRTFLVGSAYELPFDDDAFDVVMDGVALLHMTEWPRAIAEYARVATSTVVLHGVTVTEERTTTFAKFAYGQPSIELVFSRADLMQVIEQHGLRLASVHPGLDYDLEEYLGIPSVSESWVLSR
jgi:SAM-dependent methyltransferase